MVNDNHLDIYLSFSSYILWLDCKQLTQNYHTINLSTNKWFETWDKALVQGAWLQMCVWNFNSQGELVFEKRSLSHRLNITDADYATTKKCSLCCSCLLNITKTCLYSFDPLKPHFYIVKRGFTGVYIIFLISAQNHRLWVLVRTASARRF